MKTKFKYLASIFMVLLMGLGTGYAQENDAALNIQKLVENKQFTFTASSVTPLRGTTRHLSDLYEVKVTNASVVSYLPYFGVAHSPAANNDQGIRFTSSSFDYVSEKGKKDSWDIQIKFKDQTGTRQFHFVIFSNGNAVLDVTSSFRDPITFNGFVK